MTECTSAESSSSKYSADWCERWETSQHRAICQDYGH